MVPISSAYFLYHLHVALPALTTTATGFLQNYIESILALQDASCRLTQGLLPSNAYVMSYIEIGVRNLESGMSSVFDNISTPQAEVTA